MTQIDPTRRKYRRALAALVLALAALLLSGCAGVHPGYDPDITPGPTAAQGEAITPEPVVTEAPTPIPTAAPTEITGQSEDALGNVITGPDHYIRYIKFTDLVVYEEDGGTFLDGIILNSYIKPLVCAVDIVYRDEGGGELARAQLQTRDGNYMLILAPGENVVYADIPTDMTLVGMEYTLEFDQTSGVHPE